MELSKFIKTPANLSTLFLIITAFVLPLSSSLRSIVLPTALILILLKEENRSQVKSLLSRPVYICAMLLLALSVLGCFWGEASLHDREVVLAKYVKLLYLPILVVGFANKKIQVYAKYAFLSAMFITSVMLLLKAMGFIEYGGMDPGKIFHNHILTGYMLALAAYFSLNFATEKIGWQRLIFGALWLLLSYAVIFICTGRMGYIAYVLVMLVWFFEHLSWRRAMLWAGGFLVCFAVSYEVNPTMQFLVHQASDDIKFFQQDDKNTSLGLRIQFQQYTYEKLFKVHPIVGHGTGGFSAAFARDTPIENWTQRVTWEPHNQYWFIAAEYGVLGLLLLFAFFVTLVFEGMRAHEVRGQSLAILLPLFAGCLTDSLLLYTSTGSFFMFFIAMSMVFESKNSSTSCNLTDVEDVEAPPLSQATVGETQT